MKPEDQQALNLIRRKYRQVDVDATDLAVELRVVLREAQSICRRLVKAGELERTAPAGRYRLAAEPQPTPIPPTATPTPPDSSLAERVLQSVDAALHRHLEAEGLSRPAKIDLLAAAAGKARDEAQAATAELGTAQRQVERLQGELLSAQAERDEACAALEDLKVSHRKDREVLCTERENAERQVDELQDDLLKAEAERDEALAKLSRVQEAAREAREDRTLAAVALLEHHVAGGAFEVLDQPVPGCVALPAVGKFIRKASAVPPEPAAPRRPLRERLLALLAPGRVSRVPTLAASLGESNDDVRREVTALVGEGMVVALPRGYMRAAEETASPAEVPAPVEKPQGKRVTVGVPPTPTPPPQPNPAPQATPVPKPARSPRQAPKRPEKAARRDPPERPVPESERVYALRDHSQAVSAGMQQAILRALKEQGRPMSASMLRSRSLHADKRAFDGSLEDLVQQGLVTRQANMYALGQGAA